MKAHYVVMSQGAYLVNLSKAIAGRGLEGGYTLDPKKAKRFVHHMTAKAAAGQVYQGTWKKISEAS